jgi:hypothetical protein
VVLPAVLPAVFYRDVRRWQRRGAKLLGQRNLILSLFNSFLSAFAVSAWAAGTWKLIGDGRESVSRRDDHQQHAVGNQNRVAWSTQVKHR